MNTDDTKSNTKVVKTKFYQAEGDTKPLLCIEPGIPCQHAREQASELMVCVRHDPGRGARQ